ncbi:MAG: SDR family NAD(P)-dependent oxidoreductase [Aminobacterium colombiense]|jgi:NAD(P)-dependent dehydrogenase (short-subunit alcohol dehydrogenase family)|uniref:SDR family NAD(P)-dependent oxidoreductase n=1 Tax=Aminobacterium colombiense TaxID=81468 RepID=UPI001FCBE997|nr:SDR family oxidoreductase [Aminobacterium colombiense]MDD2379749.1 SDR family NAD(P)-dependent oxidoreductase [Aminobacterium colombiense]MDD4265922.1 SDR family NAD(P)-dependent oxidoreductase [Aminobacterium colombiense]MDD4586731.1 SDR family NAD(P)-dependent oxidoreductase [Aminobacterium colombiense]
MCVVSEYFEDKVAVVTGAASGIGLGITEHLLSRGAMAVFMGDVNEENLKSESERLSIAHEGKVFSKLTDVTKLEQVENLIYTAKDFDGHLDFVFNNAGMGMTLPTEKITFDIWKLIIDLNVMGVVHGTYTAIPLMREQGFGHIINTGSITGRIPVPYQAVYAATKSAVISMTESLQYELEAYGLQFSVFCPGNVATSIFGELTPPPDSISVDDAVNYIFQEMERNSLVIILPQIMREIEALYRENRKEYDEIARKLASERRENYRTKGTYF